MSTDEVGAYCPTCGTEYRPGFDVCADDGTPLVAGPAPRDQEGELAPVVPPPPPGSGARWVVIATFAREEEARLLAGRLEAEGIESQVYPGFQGGYYGESVHIPVQVLVPEHRAIEAHDVVEELRGA